MLCPMPKKDCAACHNNFCSALTDTHFKNNRCPFYRSLEDQEIEDKKCLESLVKRGKHNLITLYRKKEVEPINGKEK